MLKKHFQGGSNSCCDSLHNGDSLACLYGRCRPKRGGEIYQVTANVDDGDADGNNDAESKRGGDVELDVIMDDNG